MYISAYLLLVASFLCAIFCAGATLEALSSRRTSILPWAKGAHYMLTAFMTISSLILLNAFAIGDFSVMYVAQYSDKTLPLFYRLTAFWAGQPGSMLFWGWSVAISGLLFTALPAYTKLSQETQLWYWTFFMAIMAFFLLLVTAWNNPFIVFASPPADGQGLNPLLQNPGMIFHPPLLFLGYGGFVVPGCLALAQTLSSRLTPQTRDGIKEHPWAEVSRPFILVAWLLLTAGIILGAWWAYMELGWGGYWAWDPVENASLIPWLVATAYLHTAVIETRRGKLRRINVFLMALTTISAFFATYLVRSGVIQSLHAFGDGGVGAPLILFVLFSLGITIYITAKSREGSPALEDTLSKEGLLTFVAWILLALSFIILIATMWPVIVNGLLWVRGYAPFLHSILPAEPRGLEPDFYNRTCLPLFALLGVLLLFCPFRQWKKGWSFPMLMAAAAVVAVGLALYFRSMGMAHPIALVGASAAFAAIFGIIIMFIAKPSLLNIPTAIGAHGVHIGVLMMIAGVAFSGPYQTKYELTMNRDKKSQATIQNFVGATSDTGFLSFLRPSPDTYTLRLTGLYEGESQIAADGRPNFIYLQANLDVFKGDTYLGTLEPQQRKYSNFHDQTATEVATLPSLGNEIYATLLKVDSEGTAYLHVNVNPLINWLWVGGILMCLFPFFGLGRTARVKENGE